MVRSDESKLTVWVIDLVRDLPQSLVQTASALVLWSPDLTRVLFTKPGARFHENLYSVPADGSGGEQLVSDQPDDVKIPLGWSDTGSLLYGGNNKSSQVDLWEKPPKGDPRILIQASANEAFFEGDVTPKGDLIASIVAGSENGLYVQALRGGGRTLVDHGGAHHPRWRADGRELFYVSDGYLMAADVSSGDPIRVGAPHRLFEFHGSEFSPSQDGQRFLAAVPQSVKEPPPSVGLLLNWSRLIEK
jgi:hypothetical protein